MLKRIYFKIKREIISRFARVLFFLRKQELMLFKKKGETLTSTKCLNETREIVISLTSYSKRIETVHLTIESLGKQNLKADRIILWLDEKEVSADNLPVELKQQILRGLDVKFCENIRSYKKLIPTLKAFPNADIITVDDDVIYPPNMVFNFRENNKKNPGVILCNRAHTIAITSNNKLLPYMEWRFCTDRTEISKYTFATGIGGVYYPSGSLDADVVRDDIFMDLCPSADDVWFKFMALKNNTKTKKIRSNGLFELKFLSDDSVQDIALSNENNSDVNKNDIQINRVLCFYNINKI